MRLVCLECSAAYEAPDNLFGPLPREVRCNRCGYQWSVIKSPPEDDAAPSALSIGPAEASSPASYQPPELPRPRPTMAPQTRSEPLSVPPAPAPAPAPSLRGTARLADALTGTPSDTLAAREGPRPLLVEPTAESTRALMSSAPVADIDVAPPDSEERRLSHELDFGGTDRHRRVSDSGRGGGGTRRAVIILILLLIVAGVAAIVFKTQIVAAVPALSPIYAQLGL